MPCYAPSSELPIGRAPQSGPGEEYRHERGCRISADAGGNSCLHQSLSLSLARAIAQSISAARLWAGSDRKTCLRRVAAFHPSERALPEASEIHAPVLHVSWGRSSATPRSQRIARSSAAEAAPTLGNLSQRRWFAGRFHRSLLREARTGRTARAGMKKWATALAAARLLSAAIRYRMAAVGAALLGMGSHMGFGEHAEGRGENFPGRNLPNLVGYAYGLVDLPIAQARLSRFRDMVHRCRVRSCYPVLPQAPRVPVRHC